jgi:DUF917 family protein
LKTVPDRKTMEAILIGGSFYGGGGGGSVEHGRKLAELALSKGSPVIVDIDNVPEDAVLVTVSAVGAPAGKGHHAGADHYIRAVELIKKHMDSPLYGFISNECGGLASVNGWVQSAVLDLPLVDAPCNGRAHPTGIMGAMGLHRVPGYLSLQAACGGSKESGSYFEFVVLSDLDAASVMVRRASVMTGGLVAVARNPVSAKYVKEHGAPGALTRCMEVGGAMLSNKGNPENVIKAAVEASGGELICTGTVNFKELRGEGGFDVGNIILSGGWELAFWNEYVTLEKILNSQGFSRVATFPDLIVTLDAATGMPVSSAEVRTGQEIAVVVVKSDKLILGSGSVDLDLFGSVEAATGKKIIPGTF